MATQSDIDMSDLTLGQEITDLRMGAKTRQAL